MMQHRLTKEIASQNAYLKRYTPHQNFFAWVKVRRELFHLTPGHIYLRYFFAENRKILYQGGSSMVGENEIGLEISRTGLE